MHDRLERGDQSARRRPPVCGAVGKFDSVDRKSVRHDDEGGWLELPLLALLTHERRDLPTALSSTLTAPGGCGPATTWRDKPTRGATAGLTCTRVGMWLTRHYVCQARLMSLPEPLPVTAAEVLEATVSSPSQTLIATDFDGTLAPIVDDPEQAYADPDAVAALGRLGERVGAVAVITGRPVRMAVRLGRFQEVAGLHSLIVLGQYGVERWNAAENEYLLPPAPPQIKAVAGELPELLHSLDLAAARVEDKGRAIAVHTRSLPDPKAALVKLADPLRDLAARHGLAGEPGKNVWEIRALGVDKGATLRAVVAETGARQVIFAGDDLGDLPAFQAVRDLATAGVVGLLVCSASAEEDALAELSDVIVDGPRGLAAWLNDLAERLDVD